MVKKVNSDLASVNEGLYDELFIQKLENRLETDPLATGGLIDLINTEDPSTMDWCLFNNCEGENYD